jgi:hypothetical protein
MVKFHNCKAYVEQATAYGVAYMKLDASTTDHRKIATAIRQQAKRMGHTVETCIGDAVFNNQIEPVIRITTDVTDDKYAYREHISTTLAAGVSYMPVNEDPSSQIKSLHNQADRMLVEISTCQAVVVFNHKLERVIRIAHNVQEGEYELTGI